MIADVGSDEEDGSFFEGKGRWRESLVLGKQLKNIDKLKECL